MPIETYKVKNIQPEINEYFNLKNLYQQHLYETVRKPSLFEYKLGKIRSNYPLRFSEKPGQLVIEVMDSDFSRYLVKKTINIPQKNNVKYTLKSINKTIKNEDLMTDIYNLICKIYHLNLFTTSSAIKQGNGIELTPRQLTSLKEKYNKRLEVLRNRALNLLETRKQYNEKFRDYKTQGFNLKEILLTKQDIIQSNETTNYLLALNDLVENPDSNINYLKYLLNHYELNYYPISGNIEIGSLVLYNKQPCLVISLLNEEQAQIFDGVDTVDVDRSELKLLTGINKQLIDYHDVSSLLEEDLLPNQVGATESKEEEEKEPEYTIIIDNVVEKTKIFDKSGVLSYLPKVKTEVGAIKTEEVKKVEVVYPDYTKYPFNKLFNETNTSQLVFGSTMKILPLPGKAYGETISRLDQKAGMFNKLASISGWRRILDDSYFMPGNDSNLPYFILGKPFSSITHFLFYMMFNDRQDLSGTKLNQYNQFAERMLYTNENTNSLASMDPDELTTYIQSSPFKPHSDWTKKDLNKNKDSLLTNYRKIGLYAKFYQYPQLLNALLSTKEALLVNYRNKVFTVDFDLMEIRMVLEGKHNYSDYDHNVDKNLLDEFLVDKVRNTLADVTDNANEDAAEGIMDSEVIGNTPFGPPGPVGVITSSEPSTTGIPDPILPKDVPIEGDEEKLRNIELLKEMGLINSEMNEEEIDEALVTYSSLLDEDEAKIYQNLEDFANSYSPRLMIIDVPPNGDCLFYSIIETLNEMDILPDDFSRTTTLRDVKIGGGEKREVHTEAMNQLRIKVAKILQDNIESKSFEATKVYIENLPDMSVEQFIERTSKSADPVDGEGGIWGENIHLGIISALLNINIVVLDSTEKTMSYLAKDYRPLVVNGDLYMDLVEPVTIYLGYLVNKHYVGLLKIDDDEHTPKYEKMDYWTIMIEYKPEDAEAEIVEVALEIEGESIYPLGFVMEPNKKIEYFKENVERDDAIYELVSEQVESIDDPNTDTRLSKLTYFKNIENNEIKLEPTDEAETIGIVKLNKDNLPVIKFN